MDNDFLRYYQELEYLESLRCDIEKEILDFEKKDEKQECRRRQIENELIEHATAADYDMERCNISPRTLRLKRLAYFEKQRTQEIQCSAITKKGSRCVKKVLFGKKFCHIHFR